MRLPEDARTMFDGAYRGQRHEAAFYDFNRNLRRRAALVNDPALGFWTPAYSAVLEWLVGRFARGATVLELGCGPGLFLHALRNRGFNAVGLDVAREVVELNRRDGFTVWHGGVESVSADWVRPDAVVSFFMLHHLENPMGFFAAIRSLWPWAPLAVAQYGPGRRSPLRSAPPRNLTHWNAGCLRTALEISGYRPAVSDLPSSGVEQPFLVPLRRILKPTVGVPSLFRLNKRIERQLLPRLLQPLRVNAEVVLALADPAQPGLRDGPQEDAESRA
ncbi:MAG TPA: methyltransferase domain-containing protein [Candidatus Binataceae bacterium]|jgi:SAM-dependent methyltransferase|nr:methyltransferase domain-containing protein [Candidatus Binataceae bacterium]